MNHLLNETGSDCLACFLKYIETTVLKSLKLMDRCPDLNTRFHNFRINAPTTRLPRHRNRTALNPKKKTENNPLYQNGGIRIYLK